MVIGISPHLNKLVSRSASSSRDLFQRTFLTTVPKNRVELSLEEKEVRRRRKLPPAKRSLYEYIDQNVPPEEFQVIPKSIIKIQKEIPSSGYIINKPVTYSIKDILEGENLDVNGTAIELSPGLGYLTNQLIRLGFKHITCFEDSVNFAKWLRSRNLPIKIIDRRFLRLAELYHVDKHDGEGRADHLISRISRSPDSKKAYIFGTAPRVNVIHFIIRSAVTHSVLHAPHLGFENPVYYLLVSPRTHWVLTAKPELGFYAYRPSSVLFQLLFKWEEVGRFSRQIFIPWEAPSKLAKDYSPTLGKKVDCPFDENSCYLMKLSVNEEIVNEIGSDRLVHLWYFVKHNLYARSFTVVPKLEAWVPNCGPELIRKGFTIFTQFGDLTPTEILKLYKEFVSLPDFYNSSFIEAVEKHEAKAEVPDDLIDSIFTRHRKF